LSASEASAFFQLLNNAHEYLKDRAWISSNAQKYYFLNSTTPSTTCVHFAALRKWTGSMWTWRLS
jgi:hypothetical protein